MRSASNEKNIGLVSRIRYALKLLQMRMQTGEKPQIIPWTDIHEYEYFLAKYSPNKKSKLVDNQVLEIGFGARPWRLISLASLGVDIKGIDLDRPTYGFSPKRLLQVLKENGVERFVKSLARGVLYDRADLRQLKAELKSQNKELVLAASRMVVGNAGETRHFAPDSFTFAFSEDVFEHIPPTVLPKVVENLKRWLKPGSIAVIRPHVFTGISGGHDPDLYPHKVVNQDIPQDRAWSHLLDPDFKVNTYLNKLRLADYINLFSEHFEILEMKQKYDQLGKEYLTPELREKLIPTYTEEELLTNQIAFVLRAPSGSK
jgi:SAM-dependent methyltransferase